MPQNCPARLFRYGELVLRLLAVYSFKGQLISEWLFDSFKSSKKKKKIDKGLDHSGAGSNSSGAFNNKKGQFSHWHLALIDMN